MLKYHIMQPDPDAPTRTVAEYSTLLILVRHDGIRAEPGTAGRAVVGSVLAAVHYGSRAAAGGLRGNRAKLLLFHNQVLSNLVPVSHTSTYPGTENLQI